MPPYLAFDIDIRGPRSGSHARRNALLLKLSTFPSLTFSLPWIVNIYSFYVCIVAHVHNRQCMKKGTSCSSQFPPSTVLVPGFDLRSSSLAARALICQAILLSLLLLIWSAGNLYPLMWSWVGKEAGGQEDEEQISSWTKTWTLFLTFPRVWSQSNFVNVSQLLQSFYFCFDFPYVQSAEANGCPALSWSVVEKKMSGPDVSHST